MTMGPFAYRVLIEETPADVCASCLPHPDFDMFRIPQEVILKHALVRLPHEEWKKIDKRCQGR